MQDQAFLTVRQAARIIGKSEITIRRWIRRRCLPAVQPFGRGGHICIPRAALEGLMRPEHLPQPVPEVAPTGRHDPSPAPLHCATDAPLPGPSPRWRRR